MKTSRITTILTSAALGVLAASSASAQWIITGGGDIVNSPSAAPVGIGLTLVSPGNMLEVNGNINGLSNINAASNVTAGFNVTANNDVNANNNVFAGFNVTANSDVVANNNVIANFNVTAGFNVTANNDVTATNNVIANSNVFAGFNLNAGNDLVVTNNGFINQNLNVTNSTTVGTFLSVGGPINAGGDITSNSNINGGGHLLISGNTAGTPASGAGTRLMWVPAKAAFRAGSVTGTQWNNANIGTGSVAFGDDNIASGAYAAAFGDHVTASVYKSLVLGRYNTSTGSGTAWNATDDLLVAGNGVAGTPSNALRLQKNGNLVIAGTFATSDARLKRDVVPMTNVLSKLESIQPVYYNFNDVQVRPAERQIGFIAQEVQKEFPEAVITSDGYLAVGYGHMAAVAIQAIKEQQATIHGQQEKIAGQQMKIDELQGANTELSARLARLEQMMVKLLPGCCPETSGVNLK